MLIPVGFGIVFEQSRNVAAAIIAVWTSDNSAKLDGMEGANKAGYEFLGAVHEDGDDSLMVHKSNA